MNASVRAIVEKCPPSGRFRTYLVEGNHAASRLARQAECEVFTEFFGMGSDVMLREYAPFERASLFLLALDAQNEEVAGALRIIRPSSAGLKTLAEARKPPLCLTSSDLWGCHALDPDRCWDIGTLAVRKPYRRDLVVASSLYGHLHRLMLNRHVEHCLAILDDHVYVQLTQMLGVPFTALCESQPFPYLGSPKNRAAVLRVADALPGMVERLASLTPGERHLEIPLRRIAFGEAMPELVELK